MFIVKLRTIREGRPMAATQRGRNPSKTALSPVLRPSDGRTRGAVKIARADTLEATASRKPMKATRSTVESKKTTEEEYILEREPDGRYRLVGHRPRKSK
jgi:hypothetical protein